MHFEHILPVNEEGRAYIMTHAELWDGLRRRAIDPTRYYLGLEGCRILDRRQLSPTVLEIDRELNFGPFKVYDTTTLYEDSHVVTLVEETDMWPRSESHAYAELTSDHQLVLRSVYIWHHSDKHPPLEEAYLTVRKQAYVDSDTDALRKMYEQAKLRRSLM